MQTITTFLTFNENAQEAINLYVSLFKNSKINSIMLSDGSEGLKVGTVLHASFELDGQQFMAMDGGPSFSFEQGTSLFINCETQEEVDTLWDKLSEGGEIEQCGWLKDKFGMSWQIIPKQLGEFMSDPNREKASQVMQAMLKMTKIEIADLQAAYDQE